MEIKSVPIESPPEINLILGQAHFIKTVEDIHELFVTTVPGIKYGLAFCESSGPCLVRHTGTDPELESLAVENALKVGAGHSFIILLRNAYPINILNGVKQIQEVCSIYCATANQVKVIVAEDETGRGILGVIDGEKPRGVEAEGDIAERKSFLRKIGYKS